MISARDWERYVDYPLLVLGLGLLGFTGRSGEARTATWWATPALAVTALVLIRAQFRVFETYLPDNLASVAIKRVLAAVEDPPLGSVRLVLAEPSLAPLVQFRMERRLDFLIDYTRTFVERLPPMAEAQGAWGLRSPFRERLFEYFARTGRTPAEAPRLLWAATLRSLATGQSNLLLGLLFNVRDFWHADTDGRAGRQKEIRALMPQDFNLATYTRDGHRTYGFWFHRDLAGLKAGALRPDYVLYHLKPLQPAIGARRLRAIHEWMLANRDYRLVYSKAEYYLFERAGDGG